MILDKKKFEKRLFEYYIEYYGEKTTDVWYEQPAVNVWVFNRGGKIVTLKSHLITGEVTERIEYKL